nr:hypothetical protein [uncultured Methanolobus sp.]
MSLPELKKKAIVENTSTQRTEVGASAEHEKITRSEAEGFYSVCGQAFIRVSK